MVDTLTESLDIVDWLLPLLPRRTAPPWPCLAVQSLGMTDSPILYFLLDVIAVGVGMAAVVTACCYRCALTYITIIVVITVRQAGFPLLMSMPAPFRELGANLSAAGVNVPGVVSNRTQYCLETTISLFDDLLTHEWVIEDFPTGNRQAALELVTRIHDALGQDLDTVTWLDAPTRAAAKVRCPRTVG